MSKPKEEGVSAKSAKLRDILARMESVVVAFSGGVDSTLLLLVARQTLGENVLAITAASETSPRHEMEDAKRLAAEIGARHMVIESKELDNPQFVKNPQDKCYICKKSRFSAIAAIAGDLGLAWVADGSNVDDQGDFRPGMKAIRELGVRSPLLEAGLSKQEIRTLSKEFGLSTWNKPPYACLATRVPYGTPITAEKLGQIDAGEDLLRTMSISTQVRVRHYGETARIELAPEDIPKLLENETRMRVVASFKDLGFKFVTLDLEGYRMGSMNDDDGSRNGPATAEGSGGVPPGSN